MQTLRFPGGWSAVTLVRKTGGGAPFDISAIWEWSSESYYAHGACSEHQAWFAGDIFSLSSPPPKRPSVGDSPDEFDPTSKSSMAFAYGPFAFDLYRNEVHLNAQLLTIRPMEAKLLYYLARNHNRPVSSRELQTNVIGSSGDGSAVRNQVYELRRQLRKAGLPNAISHQRSRGYRLTLVNSQQDQNLTHGTSE